MYSPIDEIKNRLDIVDIIGSYIKLQKTGANFRALCPFHSEKKPSFFVSPARQIWHCFGCNSGGNIFAFVMKIENVEFGDALRILAQKAGVELKRERPELKTERSRLYEICELAAKFFEKQLFESKAGKEAKEYLLSRGISEESIRKWRLGYAPDVWQGLSDFLTSRGYQKTEIEKAGLALTGEYGSFYDRFRGRIVFPIFDLNSQVIGFGGRVFKEKEKTEIAKYVNTPNTLLYDKSRILYGLEKARLEIRRKDSCVLVEGYTDVILAHQNNFENVVATSGTALTPYQLKVLKRYSENLILGFDMDIAGDSATKRGINLAQSLGFNIKVMRLPEGLDPADVISQNPKEWEIALEKAKSILDFYFESAFANRDPKTPEGKKEISKILLPVIKRIPNHIERSFWLQELAKKIEVKEEAVVEEMKKVKLEEQVYGLEPEEIVKLPARSRKELLEERLLFLILKFPQNLKLIEEEKTLFLSPKAKEILIHFKKKSKKIPPEIEDYFNYLTLKSEIEEVDEKNSLSEIQTCLKELQTIEIKNQLDIISQEIKKAEEEKDSKKIEKLTQKFKETASQLNQI